MCEQHAYPVDRGLIESATGVAIPVPGTTYAASPFQMVGVGAKLQQPVELVKATHRRAGDGELPLGNA